MGEHRGYKKESRLDWGTTSVEASLSIDRITLGATLRIADAVEAMAKSHTALIEEKERYKRWYDSKAAQCNRLWRSNAALRGHLTRLKRRGSSP